MATTDKLGLAIISETDDMEVSDFLQMLSGTGDNSNMEILEEAIHKVKTDLNAIDPDGSIQAAGGIAAWISANYENAEVNSY